MRNAPALWSVLLGVLASAAVPVVVWYVDRSPSIDLIWAGASVPAAFLLGLGALAAARVGRRRAELTLRRRGAVAARVGRLLGALGLVLAGTGTISLVVYAILTYRGRS